MRSPFTSTSMPIGRNPSSSIRPANSSAVTIHGPRVVAKSLPLAGPSRTFISRAWMSRADQSLKIVYPKMWPAASSGDRSRPSEPATPPMTAPTSSSKSRRSVFGGRTSAPVAMIECGFVK